MYHYLHFYIHVVQTNHTQYQVLLLLLQLLLPLKHMQDHKHQNLLFGLNCLHQNTSCLPIYYLIVNNMLIQHSLLILHSKFLLLLLHKLFLLEVEILLFLLLLAHLIQHSLVLLFVLLFLQMVKILFLLYSFLLLLYLLQCL